MNNSTGADWRTVGGGRFFLTRHARYLPRYREATCQSHGGRVESLPIPVRGQKRFLSDVVHPFGFDTQ